MTLLSTDFISEAHQCNYPEVFRTIDRSDGQRRSFEETKAGANSHLYQRPDVNDKLISILAQRD